MIQMEIVADTIGEAHNKVVKAIIEDGTLVYIEVEPGKTSETWEYTDPVMIIVRHPSMEPQASAASQFGPGFIESYKKQLITLTQQRDDGMGFEYTYSWLLFDYPILDPLSDRVLTTLADGTKVRGYGLGDGKGINQMELIIQTLTKTQASRRANAITWVPWIHPYVVKDQPCLQFTHFLIRAGIPDNGEDPSLLYLHMRAPFRSHCMMSGYGPNAIALTGVIQYMATEINKRTGWNVQVGSLTTFSSSAHIYPVDQWDLVRSFKKLLRIS